MNWWLVLFLVAYAIAVALWFTRRLNRDQVVTTEHGVDGHVDAIEFFWRPG